MVGKIQIAAPDRSMMYSYVLIRELILSSFMQPWRAYRLSCQKDRGFGATDLNNPGSFLGWTLEDNTFQGAVLNEITCEGMGPMTFKKNN